MDFKLLWEKIENKVHTIPALIAGVLLLLIIFFAGDSFFNKYISTTYLQWIYLSLPLLWISYWLFNRFWIPRNNKKYIGLVLCIYADSNEAEQALKIDFITSVRKQMIDQQIDGIFNIIVEKNHLASKYNNHKSIYKLHNKVRGHIYIYGETKKRNNGGKEQYFLSLDGMVLHRPVEQQVSQELSKDFLATLPKGINFNDEFAFIGFQVSADIVVKSVKYIIGLAAYISGNPLLSINLHTGLKNQIKASSQKLPGDNIILSKIDDLLSNEYAIMAMYYFSKKDKQNTKINLNESLKLNPKCYRALVAQSIIVFSWENDPKKSLTIIKKCHEFDFPEWRYNEVFLHFWLGNYPSAWKQCEKIKRQNYFNEIAISQEVTQFNESIISSDNSKPVLYFWLGYNYYYKQDNLPMALEKFELFEQNANVTVTDLKQKSSAWLIEIKQKMSIK
jgi:tetratricopeptide (TPR) repeat protein